MRVGKEVTKTDNSLYGEIEASFASSRQLEQNRFVDDAIFEQQLGATAKRSPNFTSRYGAKPTDSSPLVQHMKHSMSHAVRSIGLSYSPVTLHNRAVSLQKRMVVLWPSAMRDHQRMKHFWGRAKSSTCMSTNDSKELGLGASSSMIFKASSSAPGIYRSSSQWFSETREPCDSMSGPADELSADLSMECFGDPRLDAIISGIPWGIVAFFSVFLFMFQGRTATFAGLVNRLVSLVAGTTATLALALFFGQRPPRIQDWVSFGFILVAVGFLSRAEKKRGA